MFNVLVGCEESQAVCIAFREKGHEAFSCDLKECTGGHPEWHIQSNVMQALRAGGRLAILHPPCTALTLSGNAWYSYGYPKYSARLKAIEWTIKLWDLACQKFAHVCMENPVGALNVDSRLPKPQIIQPWYFGDNAQKRTSLWLYNLPKLYHSDSPNLFFQNATHVDKGSFIEFIGKDGKMKRMPEWYANAKKIDRSSVRSKTFRGIANAMADQWSIFL